MRPRASVGFLREKELAAAHAEWPDLILRAQLQAIRELQPDGGTVPCAVVPHVDAELFQRRIDHTMLSSETGGRWGLTELESEGAASISR